jgi:YidC/Oxa1 family membrane protein insertase
MIIANVLQPLIDFNHAILRFWHDSVGLSWGLSIIGLTVVVRTLILPLTFKQVTSMQKLQVLQPEMKKIQERYKDDRQRMNEELMRFYRENKVNPLGSCLPIVLQLPFFISLFYLLRSDDFKTDIRGEESFGFIPNLAEPVTGHPGVLATLVVLYVATQLGASVISAMSITDRTQRTMMLALPFVFVVFVVNFQAGLIVYWITTNIWTIGQQLLVRKLFPKPEPAGAGRSSDGREQRPPARAKAARASVAANPSGTDNGGRQRPAPPPAPRKKKKRSGRRR